ncbi:MAG: restriction endonuclease [Cyanobacteriota bacterium]|nr:restriction endonuclease [Cyanobacteriota bacterium]
MPLIKHEFTERILEIIKEIHGSEFQYLFDESELLQYFNLKTRSANRGSKSRSGFGNLYAIYVIVEDYLVGNFDSSKEYARYEGAKFSALFRRQRELPFGSKLQNHALNHRLNQEFKKYFPTSQYQPIIRDIATNRYWINENLLKLSLGNKEVNIARTIQKIIEEYISVKQASFNDFFEYCQEIIKIEQEESGRAIDFIKSLLKPNVDARIFEIVSFAILKQYYADRILYWGWSPDELNEEYLVLYKTGRTNANDGGIDFVMKPLGRFFQVTETVNVEKYFLDIDKVQKYPITFVVKSEQTEKHIIEKIQEQARAKYSVDAVVERYLNCIEEVINIEELTKRFNKTLEKGYGNAVIRDIVLQSRVEFNVETEEIAFS